MHPQQEEENIVSGLYDGYQDTQKEILAIEIKKTRKKLFTLAAVVFVFDMITLMTHDMATTEAILYISVLPVILVVLGFLSMKEPLLAMIITAVIIVGLWIYLITLSGGAAAISGWLSKAILVYLLIAGFQSAREAQRIKKELRA